MLYVLEPAAGETAPAKAPPGEPAAVPVMLRLAPGQTVEVDFGVPEEAVAELVDFLYRIGGAHLLEELLDELAGTDPRRGPDTPQAQRTQQAAGLCQAQVAAARLRALSALRTLDGVAFAVLREQLDAARAALRLSRYGLVEGTDYAYPVVAADAGAQETYAQLRAAVLDLDVKRRAVRRWENFTIPNNAPAAREQFNAVLEPYVTAYRAAIRDWPVLAVRGHQVIDALGRRQRSDVASWAAEQDGTPLDDLIKENLGEAWRELIDEQPDFLDGVRSKAAAAVRIAEQLAPPRLGRPERIFGVQHPLWRYPHLVHAALERLDLRPGDIGYAAATSALSYAAEQAALERAEETRMEAVLGWASLGFGILAMVPVVGQFALLATGVTSAVRALRSSVDYLDASSRRSALGPLADRFGFAEPNATGFVVDLLGLVSDVALPVLGKALTSAIVPAGRLLAAGRIQTALNTGERVADLAAYTIDANAALLDKRLRTVGLSEVEGRASP
ncbi:hypothetical protein AB0F07_32350 [Streptomyces fructofermentans]|uniref:hypothetical protein n=1 Tax=Streptomyces fructofermentans TaxID=152141 RepID=UPI0033EAB904